MDGSYRYELKPFSNQWASRYGLDWRTAGKYSKLTKDYRNSSNKTHILFKIIFLSDFRFRNTSTDFKIRFSIVLHSCYQFCQRILLRPHFLPAHFLDCPRHSFTCFKRLPKSPTFLWTDAISCGSTTSDVSQPHFPAILHFKRPPHFLRLTHPH